jgi:hypothetical protein
LNVSDLQALLGGGSGSQQQDTSTTEGDQQKKKKPRPPKSDRVKAREKATGQEAVFDEKDNGGRGGWVIPGLSEKMGGPAGTKAGQQGGPMSQDEVKAADNAPPTLDNAQADFLRGAHQEAYDKLEALVKADPKMKNDPKYKKLRKHVEIELNM